MINSIPKITGNRIVMDFALEFVVAKSEKERKKVLKDINTVRLMKEILLPFELVGLDGNNYTNAYINNKEKSEIEWKHLRGQYLKLTPRQY